MLSIKLFTFYVVVLWQEGYLNGTSPSPPQFPHGSTPGNQTLYQDLSREMAALKGQMRELVIIIGNNIFGSLQVSSVF